MHLLFPSGASGSTSVPSQLHTPLHSSLLETLRTVGGVGTDDVSVDDMMVDHSDDPLGPETQVYKVFFSHFQEF
jgi:hypothetical protein